MLLYTDGLVEARNRRGAFFPLDEHAGPLAAAPLSEALDKVVDRLREFAGGRIADDVALVLAENRGA
jgi:serine phosphatase RsbU (regulator of sigma subunit)